MSQLITKTPPFSKLDSKIQFLNSSKKTKMVRRCCCFADIAASTALAFAALLLALFCAAAASSSSSLLLASAQPVTLAVPQPPAWIYNKTEWRSRLYNSLRLTPAQVQAFELVLDARDALKAPLRNATWQLAEAASNAARAKLQERNDTLARALIANPLVQFGNATVGAVIRAKEGALNATEIKLREASSAVSAAAGASASGSSTSSSSKNPASMAATLIAKALNLTADAVDRRLQDLLTIEQYREAARRSRAQAEALRSAEAQGKFATLGWFAESVAPVTTPPAPISSPVEGEAPQKSPEDAAAAAAAVAKEAAALPRREWDPSTNTTVVRDNVAGSSSSSNSSSPVSVPLLSTPPASLFAEVVLARPSTSSSTPISATPHPSSLVDASDAKIASWLSEKPLEAESANDSEHLSKVAAWVAAAPEDELLSRSEVEKDEDEVENEKLVASSVAQAGSVLAGKPSSDAALEESLTSPKFTAFEKEEGASQEDQPAPPLALLSSLSRSAARAFFRKQFPNGTVAGPTDGRQDPDTDGKPRVAVGAPTYPATSLDAKAIQASPAIKSYYRYLALRSMGFSKDLSATAVAATGNDGSLSTAIKYCLLSMKIELTDGAHPVWVGQSA